MKVNALSPLVVAQFQSHYLAVKITTEDTDVAPGFGATGCGQCFFRTPIEHGVKSVHPPAKNTGRARNPGRVRRKIPVMIPQDLLDILVCPVCKKPLAVKENGESLKCGECHRVYPVRDDIPILLVDEAVTEQS